MKDWSDYQNKTYNNDVCKLLFFFLKKYKILKLDEIKYIRESDNKKWHFYNIIAKKEVI